MAVGARAAAGSELDRPVRRWLSCQGVALVGHHDAAVESFLDFDLSASVAGPVAIGEYLDGGAVEPDGVVVGHRAQVLEAQHGAETEAVGQLSVSRSRLSRRLRSNTSLTF